MPEMTKKDRYYQIMGLCFFLRVAKLSFQIYLWYTMMQRKGSMWE
jgi:hypothetical protein